MMRNGKKGKTKVPAYFFFIQDKIKPPRREAS